MSKSMHDSVIDALYAREGDWRDISAATGVPYSTLCKIAQRVIKNPGVRHIEVLHGYLLSDDALPASMRAPA